MKRACGECEACRRPKCGDCTNCIKKELKKQCKFKKCTLMVETVGKKKKQTVQLVLQGQEQGLMVQELQEQGLALDASSVVQENMESVQELVMMSVEGVDINDEVTINVLEVETAGLGEEEQVLEVVSGAAAPVQPVLGKGEKGGGKKKKKDLNKEEPPPPKRQKLQVDHEKNVETEASKVDMFKDPKGAAGQLYRCKICSKISSTKIRATGHGIRCREVNTGRKRGKSLRQLVCNRCPYTTTTVRMMKQHRKTDHSILLKHRYSCTRCRASLSDIRCLARHVRSRHLKMKKYSRTCKICSKTYRTSSNLRRHVMDAHEVPERAEVPLQQLLSGFATAPMLEQHAEPFLEGHCEGGLLSSSTSGSMDLPASQYESLFQGAIDKFLAPGAQFSRSPGPSTSSTTDSCVTSSHKRSTTQLGEVVGEEDVRLGGGHSFKFVKRALLSHKIDFVREIPDARFRTPFRTPPVSVFDQLEKIEEEGEVGQRHGDEEEQLRDSSVDLSFDGGSTFGNIPMDEDVGHQGLGEEGVATRVMTLDNVRSEELGWGRGWREDWEERSDPGQEDGVQRSSQGQEYWEERSGPGEDDLEERSGRGEEDWEQRNVQGDVVEDQKSSQLDLSGSSHFSSETGLEERGLDPEAEEERIRDVASGGLLSRHERRRNENIDGFIESYTAFCR